MEPDSRKFNKKNPNLNNPSIPQIDNSLKQQVELPLPKAEINNSAENKGLQENTKISKKEAESYIKDLKISREELKRYVKSRKNTKKLNEKILKKEDYSIYKPSSLGEFANKLMKNTSDNLIKKFPKLFDPMFKQFLTVEMELLSRSYVSMMLLFTILALPLSFLFFLALNFAFKLNIGIILLIAFLCTIITALGFYFYPASLIGGKNSKIKLEFPFALVHMSAVAGSGAQPISIFELIAESEDYPELKKEIKKILNYINLFGYDLTTALKNVANTTASPELKELLYGMVSTIETGGDLRGYLKEKAEDALNLYRLDRKKQIEALATYSEVYTSLLIAAPLLLLVTLAIINSIGGNIGGFEVKTLAWIGVAVALPLINIGFMFFISMSQKGL
ncbi:type II secretion system F family protein [Candidatus Woesearchaeota archaeon]|nr:type II secretion system F family protein [Candidatus Woesearchaeota archaeon]